MGALCSRCFGYGDDDDGKVNTREITGGLTLAPAQRKTTPAKQRTSTVFSLCKSQANDSIFHQPLPNRNLQDSIHEEQSLKAIVDRTRAYPPIPSPLSLPLPASRGQD